MGAAQIVPRSQPRIFKELRRRGCRDLQSIIMENMTTLSSETEELTTLKKIYLQFQQCSVVFHRDVTAESYSRLQRLSVLHLNDTFVKRCSRNRGSGIAVLVNTRWCKSRIVKHRFVILYIELSTLSFLPYYLPREFATVSFRGSIDPTISLCQCYMWCHQLLLSCRPNNRVHSWRYLEISTRLFLSLPHSQTTVCQLLYQKIKRWIYSMQTLEILTAPLHDLLSAKQTTVWPFCPPPTNRLFRGNLWAKELRGGGRRKLKKSLGLF